MIVDVTKEFQESSGPEFSDRVVDFAERYLGYYPQVLRYESVDGSHEWVGLLFKDETDAMLFKITCRS